MCFAPQRRALFQHLNFQKCSEAGVFCTFWLRNVLRATTAYTCVHFFDMSTSKSGPTLKCFVHSDLEMCFAPQRRALFRHFNFQEQCVLCILTSKCASRQNGVQLFISHLPSGLRTEPTFWPSEATNHWKNTVCRDSYLFAHLDLLFSETFSVLIFFRLLCSSLTLPISAFHLSILSEVWLLNFLRLGRRDHGHEERDILRAWLITRGGMHVLLCLKFQPS